ncbi:TetR/AcrR family transcriptional regulator [Vagococcus sp. BWB3-3]|uniref:TetR/AcrR family transcriptional regulator n=1 Tax=Vagococcus allomyrinae TaxID=2794353 RepID=A0A940P312_9ENTE|nr:TetR/AcrR family transcriptional regulator [Vagococcus allomyrinae]MBP1040564.1 TetR/AcrR family transcriptional regulator [Vagococcus allomyrinae]
MNKRIKQKEATRQKIIAAAKHCYSEKGFQVATKEIALAANVSHGSIFAHFPTAELLCQEVLRHYFADVGDSLDQCVRAGTDLPGYLSRWLELVQEDQAFYRRLSSESALLSADCQAKIMGFQGAIGVDMDDLLQSLNEERPLKELPLSFLVNTWLGIMQYHIQHQDWFSSEEADDHKALISQYLLLITK